LIIVSLKKLKKLISITEDLKNENPVDWNNWGMREVTGLCDFYIDELRWCKRYNDRLWQYEAFTHAVIQVNEKREDILGLIIEKTKGLKAYMMIHSVFDVDQYNDGDWLVQFMIHKLAPTDDEIKRLHTPEEIPAEIMEKLKIFNPKPLGFSRYVDDAMIRYKLWRSWEKGKPNDPVLLVDGAWDLYDKEMEYNEVEEIISGYDDIIPF
jgi:hypothetical protein